MNESAHPAFDSEEQAILSQITADDGEMQTDDTPPSDASPAAAAETAPEQAAAETPDASTPAQADAKPADDKPAQEQPQGDVKAALRAARRSEARTRAEVERLKQENEELRKAVPATSDQDFTPDELEAMKTDFPAQYKLYVKQQELARQIAETRAATPQPATQSAEFQPIEFSTNVQELVDQVPDLLTWQHDEASQDKLKRAIAYDAALEKDPDWMDKPILERFAEAVARTKRAFGEQPAPNPAAPPAPRTDPAAAIAALKPAGPKSISDFGGGQSASAPTLNYSRMTDEEVLASLTPT